MALTSTYPPKSLSSTERLVIGRELAKAQSSLASARRMAATGGDQVLAKQIDAQLREVARHILLVQGTPPIKIAELLD